VGLRGKDLLGLQPLTPEEIQLILETAKPCKQILTRAVKKTPALRGKVVANLFYEPSTRTRNSFEMAAKAMSADVINVAVAQSSVQKGESLLDTAKTLCALGTDVIILRHYAAGSSTFLAREVDVSVINAGDGWHEHPTQALLDLFTIQEHKKQIEGLRVLIIGDILHSRVARSNIWGLSKLGADVFIAGPPTLIPADIGKLGVKVVYDLDKFLPSMDVVNLLRVQKERHHRVAFPSIRDYVSTFGLHRERLDFLRDDCLILHPGPTNLGVELSPVVADDPRAVITEQVTNGVAVRMALLYLLLAGGRIDEPVD
jgi:aspartate carbamoyltransferase catalytic subunit